MTAGTLTRADIASRINQQIGLSRNESAAIVESILDHMSDALAVGQTVKISGFGTFVLRDKAQRIGRNPKTGTEVPILPRRGMTFRACHTMPARVAGKDIPRSRFPGLRCTTQPAKRRASRLPQ